ncbi:hydroxymethylbutenyl pyrophosphate reductase [Desulfurispirillum indicum S5]|uniref:4-hydroxy-3-methylbut-2-enyl diphosphate reductase n=1 Tax=Desulfurispirillum indicum (strain ATCC BAA-1389 / DSM 22839 / S5) TaxID=653733 RepID=E6W1T8_DESIS|nr:4-hydroxy-3-methylbut-2-enyl diphosphate reductase [Desulfurispirillum indicum]ADU65470.1 hydroxymethylbutenyl pyrophosphate reductase [Desulfurispirillum indicum S5]
MEIVLGKYGGFCFGVKRAIQLAFEKGERHDGSIYTLGPIIHNPQVVEKLDSLGVREVSDLDEVANPSESAVIIRSHGVGPQVYDRALAMGVAVEDATCPYVKRIHSIVTDLVAQEYQVLIVGEPDHPEVVAIKAYAGEHGVVVEHPSDLESIKLARKTGVVAQTTQSQEKLQQVVSALLAKRNSEVRIFNTICDATDVRQKEAVEIASGSDVVLVIGGRKSGNTNRLAEICIGIQPDTYHIETAAELQTEWFRGKQRVGITAGASTPDYLISEVIEVLQRISRENSGKT